MISIFKASPAVNVAIFVGGRLVRTERGGKIVLVGPRTSIAMVPGGDVPVNFIFTERTKDDQEVAVQGDLVVRLDAAAVVVRRNFGINVRTGNRTSLRRCTTTSGGCSAGSYAKRFAAARSGRT
jgi:hypothetical protein